VIVNLAVFRFQPLDRTQRIKIVPPMPCLAEVLGVRFMETFFDAATTVDPADNKPLPKQQLEAEQPAHLRQIKKHRLAIDNLL